MRLRPLILVLLSLAAAIVVLVIGGRRIMERDREMLVATYRHDRTHQVEEAAAALAADLSDIGEDLELAAALLAPAESSEVAERELHAIATVKREYLGMDARFADRPAIRVIAPDSAKPIVDRAGPELATALAAAQAAPDSLQISRSIDIDQHRYRVFAQRSREHGVTIAVVVETQLLVDRLKVPRDARTAIAVFGPEGATVFATSPNLTGDVPGDTIDAAAATQIGLPAAPAIVMTEPVDVARGAPWRLVVVASTSPLGDQQDRIIRRVLLGGALVALLLASAAAYIIHNARRATLLRERLRHADRLAHLTERAEKIVDHIPSGVLMLASDARITGANRWFVARFGRDVVGQPLDTIPDASVVTELVVAATAAREARSLHRVQLALFGEHTWMNLHAVPLERAVADVTTLLVFEDLTTMRRIEDRLVHTEKLATAGQLAAGIAHEIGTPLNVARGRVELAMSHLGAAHAEAPNHRVVIEQIDRVTRLIEQLLDYVRPAPPELHHVDAAAVLLATRELLASRAEQRGVGIASELPPALPALLANPDQFQQVVVNLTLNAIDACARGGAVRLIARLADGAVEIEVSDDGHGIPAAMQAQVFDPFFTTKKRGQGTGLGLWVVAQIVRAHHAEIHLESAPGAGTTVRIAWPVAS